MFKVDTGSGWGWELWKQLGAGEKSIIKLTYRLRG